MKCNIFLNIEYFFLVQKRSQSPREEGNASLRSNSRIKSQVPRRLIFNIYLLKNINLFFVSKHIIYLLLLEEKKDKQQKSGLFYYYFSFFYLFYCVIILVEVLERTDGFIEKSGFT